ncbi:unnamed protein product [Polarella glacialis]|uniref:Uncharacterized protein n=1 Tax=Polarella glacialis TaxID=89957 RepID=A0A813JMI0_POLGL|nr:unnamed protein product [Polarella glacialis]
MIEVAEVMGAARHQAEVPGMESSCSSSGSVGQGSRRQSRRCGLQVLGLCATVSAAELCSWNHHCELQQFVLPQLPLIARSRPLQPEILCPVPPLCRSSQVSRVPFGRAGRRVFARRADTGRGSASWGLGAFMGAIGVLSLGASVSWLRGPSLRGLVARRYRREEMLRFENERYAKWDPKQREQCKTPEDAERILRNTGLMPRTLRLSDVKTHTQAMRKTIVANAGERRKISEMVSIYGISKLQARLQIQREFHPVWGHQRILVYGKLTASYLVPCSTSNEPMEVETPLKFKAAFREDADPFFPTRETLWNKELEKRGLRPDIAEGKKIEPLLMKTNPSLDAPDNMICEAILDNVVDLGEVVLQFFACHVDRYGVSDEGKKNKFNKRMSRRMSKELGVEATWTTKDETPEADDTWRPPTAQELHDCAGGYEGWTRTTKMPKYRMRTE